jgi:hypothetical protein
MSPSGFDDVGMLAKSSSLVPKVEPRGLRVACDRLGAGREISYLVFCDVALVTHVCWPSWASAGIVADSVLAEGAFADKKDIR